MEDNKKIGRPASYFAEYFAHFTNHDGEPHVRHIERKWGLPGYAIYYKLLEKIGSAQHHYLHFKTDEDKLDLYDQLRPAEKKDIQDIIKYLISKLVLDQDLYDQGIIYSPFLVNTLSTLYSTRNCKPLIPEINEAGILVKKVTFPFSKEKYLFSTVKDMLYKENPANRTEDNNIEVNLKKDNPTEPTAPSQGLGKGNPEDKNQEGDESPVSEEEENSSKTSPVDVSVSVPAGAVNNDDQNSANVKDIIKNTAKRKGIDNLMYLDNGSNAKAVRAETGRNWSSILIESTFIKEIKEEYKISKDKLIQLYNQYGGERLLDCYAYTILKNDQGKVKGKPSGYFIKAVEGEYQINEDDNFIKIKSEISERNPELH